MNEKADNINDYASTYMLGKENIKSVHCVPDPA